MTKRFLATLLLLCSVAAHAAPQHNGFNMPCWWEDCYGLPGTKASLSKMAATGAGWVALIPSWYQNADTDSSFAPDRRTPNDDGIRAAIRAAKAAGLSVALKPHVDSATGHPRSVIRPKDAKAWFTCYRTMTAHYARIAAEEHADMYVIGTELFLLDGLVHRGEWVRTIAEARAVFPGPMTYASNWYGFSRVSFWDKLDFIGIDGYFPILNGHQKWAMKLEWEAYKPLIAAASALSGKPVLFTEFGLASQKGANLQPWQWKDFGPVDLEVQKNYFESFLEVFGTESWFAGIWQWGWEIDPDAGGPKDKSMTVQGKPALDSLQIFFAKSKAKLLLKGLAVEQKTKLDSTVGQALLGLKGF